MTKPLFTFDDLVLTPELQAYAQEYEDAIYEEMRMNDLVESQAIFWRLNGTGKYIGVIIGGKEKAHV